MLREKPSSILFYMENTLLLFEDQVEKKWFVVVSEKLLGPVSGKEIALWFQSGDITLATPIWMEGFTDWKRIHEVKDFAALQPTTPGMDLLAQAKSRLHKEPESPLKTPPPPGKEQRIWFLYMNDSQYGPFSESEVRMMADAGRVSAQTYVWKKGMADWQLAPSITELNLKFVNTPKQPAKQMTEKRQTPRRPFEAKILLTDGQEVGWALCRDVSIGGMQVLMDRVPGGVGTTLKLNISAANDIPSFTCEGEIVRILEDKRGFSFRFVNLPPKAKGAIEEYIS